ncbi:MAG: VanZ family protein [bacterium]
MKNDLLSPLAYMALLFVLATLPGDASSGDLMSEVPTSLQNLAHVPAYGFLALLWITTLKNLGMPHQGSLVLATCLASTYGALTEFCQIWAPGRFPSLSDGLLDLVGSLLVVSMYQMPGFPGYGLNDMRKPEA